MKHLFLITGCVLFLSSCEMTQDDVYHILPEKYKTQINDFDTILFYSNSDIDTLFIRKIYDATFQYALGGTSCKGPYEYWNFECLYYFKYHLPDNNCENWFDNDKKYGECGSFLPECEHAIQIQYGIKSCSPIIHFNNIYYQLDDSLKSIVIDGVEYQNIYLFTPKTGSTVYSKLFFNYKYGLLRYISDSIQYEIKNPWLARVS